MGGTLFRVSFSYSNVSGEISGSKSGKEGGVDVRETERMDVSVWWEFVRVTGKGRQ